MISDSQIFIALLFALVSAVLAIQLGAELFS
jgi:photosystem I reaction center subunit XII